MAHKSFEELEQDLETAAESIKIQRLYEHHTLPNRYYEVLGFAVIEATDEVGVRYVSPEYPKVEIVNPIHLWLSLESEEDFETLYQKINDAEKIIQAGVLYEHYKSPRTHYEALGFVIMHQSELAVRYVSLDYPRVEFARPVSEWVEEVEGRPRFKPLDVPQAPETA